MIIGQKNSKDLILSIPFGHPESFVMSADRKKKTYIYYFPAKHHPGLPMSYLTPSEAEPLLWELFGTTWICLMNSRVFPSLIGILTKPDGNTLSNSSVLPLQKTQ